VPRFGAGNAMMYAEGEEEIEEYIRYGAPLAWQADPEVAERLASQRIRMPAYEGRLDDGEIADLTLWTSLVEGVSAPGGAEAEAGRVLARKHGCLACHGEEGAGGLPNPGSLGGFIPGFLGRNFEDLVSDETEFREWVRTGTLERLEKKVWVRHFWQRQAIAMPAYGEALDDEELAQLWTWIQAVREDLAGDG
jgi:cytochrome c553